MNHNLSSVNRFAILFLITIFFAACSSETQTHEERQEYSKEIAQISASIEEYIATSDIPAISVAFYKDGFTWSKGFGFADLENQVAARAETKYRMASVNKPMTATAIVKLAVDGKLGLDDEVQKYVSYFPQKKWPITIRQILGHLSGISHYRDYDKEGYFTTPFTTEEAIDIFKNWELEFEPGTKWLYSSYAYNLLGAVIEGASGMSYSDYMTKNIWQPLGMIDTRMDVQMDIIPNRASGYKRHRGKVINTNFLDISSRLSSGGILSTVEDMISFARGMDDETIMSFEDQMQMYEVMKTKDGNTTSSGMGISVDYISGFWTLDHGGGQAGSDTYLLRFPGENFAVAVASNFEGANSTNVGFMIASKILGAYKAHFLFQTPSRLEFTKMYYIWHVGLGYHSKYGKPLSSDPEKLKAGFEYLNLIDLQLPGAIGKLVDGFEEKTSRVNYMVGSYMSEVLANKYGINHLYTYRNNGPIPFMKDYIELYRKNGSIPVAYHFSEEFESLVEEWSICWDEIWNDETREIINPLNSFSLDTVTMMRDLYAGKIIHPDFSMKMTAEAYRLKAQGNLDEGLEMLLNASELYPRDANIFDSIGEFYIRKGDKTNSIKFYKIALNINPKLRTSLRALEMLTKEE